MWQINPLNQKLILTPKMSFREFELDGAAAPTLA
jgi:hypothetical protein